jgi:hypothetical protein
MDQGQQLWQFLHFVNKDSASLRLRFKALAQPLWIAAIRTKDFRVEEIDAESLRIRPLGPE